MEENLDKVEPELKNAFQSYIDANDDREKQRAVKDAIIKGVKASSVESVKPLAEMERDLVSKSVWIIGGDGWSYDIGYGGLDHAIRSEFGVDDQERLIVYVGRLAKEKSMDIVINGFKKAIDQGSIIKLLIVGGGPDEDNCREMVKKLGIEKYVFVAGPRPAADVPDIYRAADGFVSASLSETQGMTFIEALAAGLPILVRKDEVLEGLCIEGVTGSYFQNENDLAEKLKVFLNMDQKRLDEMHVLN